MLGEAVHSGLQKKDSALGNDSKPDDSLKKRKRESEGEETDEKAKETSEEPIFKKARTDGEESATPPA
jgi:hypothetical protein